jgi:hypothetical protein
MQQQQESFLEQNVGQTQIEVLKSYDESFAREAFVQMDESALAFLVRSLDPNGDELTLEMRHNDPDFADAVWEEMRQGAREDWNAFSYFVVVERASGLSKALYVSPDWPSAESFAKQRLAVLQ